MASSLAVPVALCAALLFIVVSSPTTYKITNGITTRVGGLSLADAAGNPKRWGLVVHALVFFAVMYGYARLNKI